MRSASRTNAHLSCKRARGWRRNTLHPSFPAPTGFEFPCPTGCRTRSSLAESWCRQISGAGSGRAPGLRHVAPSGPTLDEFPLPGVELIDQVRAGVTNKRDTVIVHRDLGEMTGTGRRGDHVRDKLVVSRATLRLHNTHAFIRTESCI